MAVETLVSFAVEAALTKLLSTVAGEVSLFWGLKGDIKKLSDKLNTILDLLKDAEQKQQKGATMDRWILNLKNAAYDAEDVLDLFAFEMLRRKLEIQTRMKNKARNFFSVSNPIMFRIKMAHKVKDVNMVLTEVVKDGFELGLNQALHRVSPTIHTEIPQTHPFLEDSNIILGREADTSKVVEMLLQSESGENLSVISVVGLGGLGKTTLTQLVYKDQRVTSHFIQHMWVCVSDDFNVTRILKQMLEYLEIYVGETSNIGGLIQKLQKKLNGKKYLLVLDDVWNTDGAKWESLRNSLIGIGASKESRVLVTTRNVAVASTMTKTLLTHHLSVLSEEDSWSLFHQRAFATGGAANETPYLVGIAKKMSKRCGGVPLPLSTLGAMMYSIEANEWPSIWESFSWDVERGIMPALQLSFNNLQSPCLKQCFAYCSIFPKDFILEKDDLIQLWIAQGFIPTSEGGSNNTAMEDIGNGYFKTLLWNSFFQDAEMDECGNIKTCKMHDLMHDLAQALSKSECLILDANDPNVSIEIRHLALAGNREIMPVIVEEHATKVRTFFPASTGCEDILLKFKFLHTLKLVGTNIKELPATIGKLKQLRYLDVSKTEIEVYPACIAKLYNLQTLRLAKFHLSVELQEKFNNLVMLRHLYFDSNGMSLMPIAMGKLTCLQTLTCFVVGKDQGRRISELGSLSNLGGKLDIRNLEYVSDKEEAKKANLMGKTNVYKLKLAWSRERGEGDNNNDEDVLEGLQPPPNLQSLTIENFSGSNFPSWIMISQSLVSLKLIGCSNCEQIPTLGELPFLQFLEIKGMSNVKFIGKEFYSYSRRGDGGTKNLTLFPKLKSLAFRNMHRLVKWSKAASAATTSTTSSASSSERGGAIMVFPCLEELTINNCYQLKTAPSHFPCLRKLNIDGIESGAPIVNIGSKMSTLTHLDVAHIPELGLLLQNNKNLTFLQMLYCEMVTISPDGLCNQVYLEGLRIECCPNLTSSMVSIQGLTSLKGLTIDSCDGMTSLPIGLGSCASLEDLYVVDCTNLVSVAEEDLSELKSLSSLTIRGCEDLKSIRFERFLHCLPRLQSLEIGGFSDELDSFPFTINVDYIQQLPQLQFLELYGWPKLKFLPDHIQHFTTLRSLDLNDFEELEVLPDWLGKLSSLESLYIFGCGNLKSLPSVTSIQRLSNLQHVGIGGSPILKERCLGNGPEAFKIPHFANIAYIDIDGLIRGEPGSSRAIHIDRCQSARLAEALAKIVIENDAIEMVDDRKKGRIAEEGLTKIVRKVELQKFDQSLSTFYMGNQCDSFSIVYARRKANVIAHKLAEFVLYSCSNVLSLLHPHGLVPMWIQIV